MERVPWQDLEVDQQQLGIGLPRYRFFQIWRELLKPFSCYDGEFGGMLVPFAPPSAEERFWLLCGETPATLKKWQLVDVTVHGFSSNGIFCRLESGVRGFSR
jgi:hypothetical protein